ncbi:MAG TPA: phosphoribosylpyrophosphate synthetase [Cytophagales bacterium]|jgi:hypothetical protein|nr:phosphoribosylpyrophosphate synthetase [Cytophagales bacterium]
MKNYETMSEAVNDLNKRGYTYNFNLGDTHIKCAEEDLQLTPDEFEIDEVYRFEGMTDPGDENVVYAISAKHHPIKGQLVNAYGVYFDKASEELIAKLKVHH